MTVIATAQTKEAYDREHGHLRVYGPDDTHDASHIWDPNNGDMPDGVWLSPCGNWRSILISTPGMEEDSVTRNFCYCPFCKELRRSTRRA
jgi:hypothetical protein